MKYFVCYIFFFCLYFCLHYAEGLPPIGPFSVAQLWKIPILFVLLVYAINSRIRAQRFEKSCYLLTAETFFSPETVINPLPTFIQASKLLPVVLFFRFWISKFKSKKSTLETIMYALAQFICLSSLLTLTGLVHPLYTETENTRYGIEGLTYYRGVFGSFHAASSYFCIAILVLIHGFMTKRFRTPLSKLFNLTMLAIAFVSIFKAYVRTGWLMLLVGLFFLLGISRASAKKIATQIIPIFILSAVALVFFYNTNEAFQARVTNRNVYTETGGEAIDTGGSGRTEFWKNGITLWANGSTYEILFGNGFTKVTQNNLKHTGLAVFSHNQFVDMLSQNGLLGLLLLIAFNIYIFRFLKQTNEKSSYRSLGMAVFWSNLIFSFFQNEMYFDFAVIFSLILAINYIEQKEKSTHNF